MDKQIKKLKSKEKSLLKSTDKLLKADIKNDKIVNKAKKKMKSKC